MIKIATLFVVATFAIAGMACSKDKKDGDNKSTSKKTTSDKKPNGPEPTKVSFDANALAKSLVGTWTLGKDPAKPTVTYTFTETTAKIVNHNIIDSKTKKPSVYEGKLEISGANEFKVVQTDGTKYIYNFATIDGKTHISVSKASKVANLAAFKVKLGMFNTLERTAKGCVLHRKFKNDKIDVKCSSGEKDGKITFTYQTPDRFNKGKMTDNTLFHVGGYLVNEQFLSEVATKK